MIVAGTGHRPDKLGGYGKEVHERLVHVACTALGDIKEDIYYKGFTSWKVWYKKEGYDEEVNRL